MHIACEELNFMWTKNEVRKTRRMLNDGYKISDMAEELKRDIDEVAILIIDLGRGRRIER